MKKWGRFLCAVLFFLTCTVLPAFGEEAEVKKTYELSSVSDRIKPIGRTAMSEKGLVSSWSNSGFAFSGNFGGEIALTLECRANECNIAVVIDGNYALASRYQIQNGLGTYTVSKALEKGEHTVEIYKLNEAPWGYLVFQSLSIDGTLSARPADKKLKIEFIGDSITCGYGIFPAGGSTGYPVIKGQDTEEEDSFFSFAGITARELNADASFISCGGWGVVTGYDVVEHNIPRIYGQICGVTQGVSQEAWDFQDNQVDLVVCNLGTNDWSVWNGDGGTETLSAGITAFCKTIRACYPNAKIVWCYGMIGTDMMRDIRSAVESVGDPNLTYLSLPSNTDGAVDHPDYWGQAAGAKELLSYLSKLGFSKKEA